jgi:hypothetical protein
MTYEQKSINHMRLVGDQVEEMMQAHFNLGQRLIIQLVYRLSCAFLYALLAISVNTGRSYQE